MTIVYSLKIENCKLEITQVSQDGIMDELQSMNKESIIAVAMGLVLGIGVAFGAVYYTVNKQKQTNTAILQGSGSSSSASLKPNVAPPTVTVLQSLEITSPVSGSITQEKTVIIKGTAGPKTLIIVQSPIKTQTQTIEKSTFSLDFPLAQGENTISISAYHKGAVIPVQKKLYIYRLIP